MENAMQVWSLPVFVVMLPLGGLILWLIILVIRLRMEALVNRRVIASLQKGHSADTKAHPWGRTGEILYLFLLTLLAITTLLLVYQVVAS